MPEEDVLENLISILDFLKKFYLEGAENRKIKRKLKIRKNIYDKVINYAWKAKYIEANVGIGQNIFDDDLNIKITEKGIDYLRSEQKAKIEIFHSWIMVIATIVIAIMAINTYNLEQASFVPVQGTGDCKYLQDSGSYYFVTFENIGRRAGSILASYENQSINIKRFMVNNFEVDGKTSGLTALQEQTVSFYLYVEKPENITDFSFTMFFNANNFHYKKICFGGYNETIGRFLVKDSGWIPT